MSSSNQYEADKTAVEPDYEKNAGVDVGNAEYDVQNGDHTHLKRELKSRHMQMIAIGGAIGAGLFVGAGGALSTGGPASLLIGFIIIGAMLLVTVQALAELAVLYPVNGAFFSYAVRFLDPSWGFAMGWDYAISWLTVLPYEITAATLTISFWPGGAAINPGVWVAVFLTALSVVQIFGVKGYGEVEFILAIIKVCAILGFIILAIVIDVGGVPTDPRGYIGAHYWYDPGAFANGFKGFCSVFVTASFAFGGTELTGLAAAESANPRKAIPQATKQVFWRISFFYIISLFLLGLIVPYTNGDLLHSSGADTKYSPFVIAMNLAHIKVLPSIFNVCITMAVLSVANSCAYGSTRTIQALAMAGMAPKFLAYVDKKGRPVPCIILQLLFGLLAFVNESGAESTFFTWMLSLSGLGYFFVWGSICLSHIRFRAGWKAAGRSVEDIPYTAMFGIYGSWFGFILNVLCLIAQFYVALFPVGGVSSQTARVEDFFEAYLAAPIVILLYLFWKIYSRDWTLFVRAKDMDILTGMRNDIDTIAEEAHEKEPIKAKNIPMQIIHAIF